MIDTEYISNKIIEIRKNNTKQSIISGIEQIDYYNFDKDLVNFIENYCEKLLDNTNWNRSIGDE